MEKELLCRTCKICLTDENKVTKENICKSCNKINSDEFINHYKKIKKFATENNIKLKLKKYKNYFNEL